MELSFFLAQLFGLTMIIFIAIVLLRPRIVDGMIKDLQTPSLAVVMTSFVSVMGGLAVVLTHNIWEASWVGIVTFFGWAAFIKGITIIAFPSILIKASGGIMSGNKRNVVLIIALLFVCYLTFKGFGN